MYFLTGNSKKLEEFQYHLPQLKMLDIDLPEIQSLDPFAVTRAKLQAGLQHHMRTGDQLPLIVEDTSLSFDRLNGLPGPLIKLFLKALGDKGLYNFAEDCRSYFATARTVIGYTDGIETKFFEGVVEGRLIYPRGESTFGWDNMFVPNGYKQTYAKMTPEEKNSCSMRQKAIVELKKYLASKT